MAAGQQQAGFFDGFEGSLQAIADKGSDFFIHRRMPSRRMFRYRGMAAYRAECQSLRLARITVRTAPVSSSIG